MNNPEKNQIMDRKNVLEKIGNVISEFDSVDVAYVFGSFLENDRFNDFINIVKEMQQEIS